MPKFTFIKRIANKVGYLIKESTKDSSSKYSSTRIQSYVLLALFYIFGLSFIVIEFIRFFKADAGDFTISNKFMGAFGIIASHHLALLGINKNSKAEPKPYNIKNDSSNQN